MTSVRIHVALGEPISRPGGLHRYVQTLAQGQRELGYDVFVLDDVRRRGYGTADRASIARAVAQSEDAWVEYHFAKTAAPFVYGPRHRAFGDARQVLHYHGPWMREGIVQGDGWLKSAYKWVVEALAYRRFDTVIAASNVFAQEFASTWRQPAATSVRVVHPGVDCQRFIPLDKSEARRSMGLGLDQPIVACVRRLEPRMGIDVAIRAMQLLPDTQLVIAGTGSQGAYLRRLVEDLGLEARVHLLGRVHDDMLPSLYAAADVTVVPTRSLEGFGMVVLESMACGTPVVASEVGGLREAMGPFADEWTVPAEDEEALALRVREALELAGLREDVREYALTRSPREMARRVEEILVGPWTRD